jgi:arylformamidase
MPTIDISLPLHTGIPGFPAEPAFALFPIKRIADGENDNVSAISMSLHSGTHLDMPWHFLEAGAKSEMLDLRLLNGPAQVVEVVDPVSVKLEHLRTLDLNSTERLVIRTRNSQLYEKPTFTTDFVYIEPEAAQFIAESGVKLLGFDYLSIEKYGDKQAPAHKALLSVGTLILEGLNLSEVAAGDYVLRCLPLRIVGAEALPARALLDSL